MAENGCTFARRFPTALVVLVLLCAVFFYRGFSYRSFDLCVDTNGFVSYRYQMLENLQQVSACLTEDESALRGYLLTGDVGYLNSAERARQKLAAAQDSMTDLRYAESRLTRSDEFNDWNYARLQRLDDLSRAIATRLAYTQMIADVAKWPTRSQALIEVRPKSDSVCERMLTELAADKSVKETNTGRDAAQAMFALNRGQPLLNAVYEKLDVLETDERKLLHERLELVHESALLQAEIIVAVHFAFVSVVVGGLVLTLLGAACRWQWVRNPWFRFIHLGMILFVIGEIAVSYECPLTTWERDLKLQAGMQAQEGGFIARTLHALFIYDEATISEHGAIFMTGYIIFGSLVLGSFWIVPPRFRKKTRPTAAPMCEALPPSTGIQVKKDGT